MWVSGFGDGIGFVRYPSTPGLALSFLPPQFRIGANAGEPYWVRDQRAQLVNGARLVRVHPACGNPSGSSCFRGGTAACLRGRSQGAAPLTPSRDVALPPPPRRLQRHGACASDHWLLLLPMLSCFQLLPVPKCNSQKGIQASFCGCCRHRWAAAAAAAAAAAVAVHPLRRHCSHVRCLRPGCAASFYTTVHCLRRVLRELSSHVR